MAIKCGNRTHGRNAAYHENTNAVRACFKGRQVPIYTRDGEEVNPANSFAHGTAHVEVETPNGVCEKCGGSIDFCGGGCDKSYPVGSKDEIRARNAKKAPAFDTETLEDGFYALPDPAPGASAAFTVYKVVVAIHGSGRKYAKRLDTATGEWERAPGSIRKLRPEMRMTLREALVVAKIVATNVEGRLYGRCFVCGRLLTKEDSIDRMMGDVCAGKFA